jgi:hypothetical protein
MLFLAGPGRYSIDGGPPGGLSAKSIESDQAICFYGSRLTPLSEK